MSSTEQSIVSVYAVLFGYSVMLNNYACIFTILINNLLVFVNKPNLIQLHMVFFMTFAAVATACLLVLFLTSIASFQVRVKNPLLPRVRVTAR